MMTLLAGGLKWLLGSKLLPMGVAGGLLLMGHQLWASRDAGLKAEATAKCEAGWELASLKAQRDSALREVKAAQERLENERQLSEGLRNDHKTVHDEFVAYKTAMSNDPRCLSDSVLDLLRGLPKVGGGG